jgi:hypothetical protein
MLFDTISSNTIAAGTEFIMNTFRELRSPVPGITCSVVIFNRTAFLYVLALATNLVLQ